MSAKKFSRIKMDGRFGGDSSNLFLAPNHDKPNSKLRLQFLGLFFPRLIMEETARKKLGRLLICLPSFR